MAATWARFSAAKPYQLPFEVVRDTIAERLRAGVQKHALEQYVRILAGKADVRGVDLGAASTPLVQ